MLTVVVIDANGATVTFDNYRSPTENDYVNGFNDNGGGTFIAVPSGGITGGALQVSAPLVDYPVYKTAFDLSAGLSTSIFLKYDNILLPSGGPTVQLGVCGTPTDRVGGIFDPTVYFWGQFYNDGQLGFYSKAVQTAQGNGFVQAATFTPPAFGDWLKLSFDVKYLGANQFQLSTGLEDYGPNGTGNPTSISLASLTVTDPNAATDTTAYVGFSGYYHVSYFDNFSVDQVPEPTSTQILVSVGLLALLAKFKAHSKSPKA